MRRLWLALLILVFLAACSSAPQKVSRSGSSAGYAWRTKPPGFPNFVDHSVGREEISIQAMGLVGIPYRWGGNTPDSGFDCSGLVKYVFARAASEDLPRTTLDMSQRGESIEPDQIAAGDLVFFNTTGRPHSHVGIYVGKLRFVNAPSTGGTVRLDYLTNPYWAKHFDGIRRLAPAKRAPTPFDAPTYDAAAPAPRAPAVAAVATPVAPAVTPSPAAANAYAATAAPSPVAQNRLTSASQPSYANSAPAADAFEPPPPAMSAAQTQARDAAAVAPTAPPDAPRDAIDAAADAFEPPPPAMNAAQRQAAQAGSTAIQSSQPVQIMRASTAGSSQVAPTQSSDDPIARFANGSF
ncbi:C40 family peptidase [Paraburkholderia bannensis]|uniref:C40 family peptidase n=1 Tax=Paraburkholderia bannensis TaxID=765414 RepID=UPI002AB154D8|nr:C40 family peptidase [Paraburkholderia bannensis]